MARTILMIHGYGCAGDCWGPVARRLLAEGYRVETPTIRSAQRTVGAPPADLAGLSLADYVADMSALAASLARETGEAPIVFGHSMGGLITQKLAEAGLTSGVVLFAPASPADARGKPKLSPLITFLNAVLTPRPETKAVKMWKTGFKWGVLNAVPAARHDALYAKAVHDSGRVLADLAWPDKDPNRTAHVDTAKVTAPVLVVAGARDRTTPVEDLRLVGAKYGADYVEYPANAHWLIDEPGTDIILDDVTAWLINKGLEAAPRPAAKPAPKAAAKTAKAEPAAKASETTVKEKPTPKAKTSVKAAPKAKAEAAAPAPTEAEAKPKAPAKPKAKAKAEAKPAPAAKAPAKPAPKAKVATPAPAKAPAKTVKSEPKAKAAPVAKTAPAAKAPAKTAKAEAKPKAPAKTPAKTKAPATTSPAKSSPKDKKSV